MKHSFKNPQKKGKIYISYSSDKIILELNEVKIKNLKELNDKRGYFLECNIPEITIKSKQYFLEGTNVYVKNSNGSRGELYGTYQNKKVKKIVKPKEFNL